MGGQRSCWVHFLIHQRCKMFSHGPMSGARGAKGLVGYMFSYAKGAKCLVMALCLGPGGPKVLLGTCSHMQKVQNV